MSSSFAAKWLLQFAVSRLEKSTAQVTIDALLCSLRPSYGGLEELRIDSDHIQASGFDVLRWHDNYHELGTRHCLSSLTLAHAGFFISAFCFRQAMLHPTRRSLPSWEYLQPDPPEKWMSGFHVITPNTKGLISKCRGVWSRRFTVQKQAALECWCSAFVRHFSVTLKMPPAGLHTQCHTLRSVVSSALVPSAKHLGAKSVVMGAFARLVNKVAQLSRTPERPPKNPESRLNCWVCSWTSPISMAVIGKLDGLPDEHMQLPCFGTASIQ